MASLRVPALGIYGKADKIVDPHEAHWFGRVADSRVVMLEGSRHFPMLDEPERFYSIMQHFLAN
jgi:pimeloyl-ACP methyl ester carboxylesterase